MFGLVFLLFMRRWKHYSGQTLGEGNSAKVKLATDTVSGQSFAVKIIDKSRTSRLNVPFQVFALESSFFIYLVLDLNGIKVDSSSYNLDSENLQIKREIRTLKVLKHPNIVRLHEVNVSIVDGKTWIVRIEFLLW